MATGRVSRSGSKLMLNGAEFRLIGFDYFWALVTNWNQPKGSGPWPGYLYNNGSNLDNDFTTIKTVCPNANAIRVLFLQQFTVHNTSTGTSGTGGVRDWSPMDKCLNVADQHGLRVIACLGDNWSYPIDGQHNSLPASWFSGGYKNTFVSGWELEPYYNWVTDVVTRYKGDNRILLYEMGNELNGLTASFTQSVCDLIKSIDPGALTGDGGGGYNSTIAAVSSFDVSSYHYYTDYNQLNWNGNRTTSFNAGKCSYIGECGFDASLGVTGQTNSFSNLLGQVFPGTLPGSNPGECGFIAWGFWGDSVGGDTFLLNQTAMASVGPVISKYALPLATGTPTPVASSDTFKGSDSNGAPVVQGGGGGGTPVTAVVQTTSNHNNAAGSLTLTFPAPLTAGNAVIVVLEAYTTGAAGDPVSTVALNDSTAVPERRGRQVNASATLPLVAGYDVFNVSGGQTSVIITLAATATTCQCNAQAYEVSGLTGVADQIVNATGSSAAWDSTAGTTTSPTEFWVGFTGTYGVTVTTTPPSPATGWTSLAEIDNSVSSNFSRFRSGWQVVNTTGSVDWAGTFSASVPWAAQAFSYVGTPGSTSPVRVSDSDGASSTDAGVTVTSPRGSDSATGADAVTTLSVHQSSSDTSASTETGQQRVTGSVPVTDADSGAGAEAVVHTGLSDGDTTNAAEIDQFLDSDGLTGAEAAFATVTDADAGTATDTVAPNNAPQDADAGLFAEVSEGASIALASSDGSAATVEATGFLPALPFSSSDAGAGAEAVTVLLPEFSSADAGMGTEAAFFLGQPADTDSITANDLVTFLSGHTSADSASGVENAVAARLATDTGTGTDSSGVVQPEDSDGAAGAENSRFPSQPRDDDTGRGTETGLVTHVTLSASDGAGSAESANAVSSALLFGVLESFSVSRAAVLTGGVESAQLYGVRGGTVVPTFSTHESTADDQVVLEWNDQISMVTVTISGGFIPFAALSKIMGGVFSQTATSGAVGFGVLSTSGDFSLVLRMLGRSFLGFPRTIDLVLYRCNFQKLAVTETYKTGVDAEYTAFAVLSSVDEAGNVLPTQEVGRLVSSPGALSGPIGQLFGRGT